MKKYLGIILAVLISLSIFIFRDKLLVFGNYGYFGLFILNVLGSATLAIPTPLFMTAVIAGSVLNPILVILISSFGSTLGELTGYWAGQSTKHLLDDDRNVVKVKKWMEKYGLWTLFVLSAVPNPIFDAAGIFAGATQIPIKKYLGVVWLGKIIKFGVLVFMGNFMLN